jgi:site-specific recombinase XerD
MNLDKLVSVVRNGKGGKTSVCYLSEEAVFELEGSRPLFLTDYGGRFDRKDIYRLVIYYKEKAGIKKPGGAHILFRHTPASLMIQNGCDLLTIQQVMRHNNIQTTMLYLHLADETKRYKYDKFLRL